MIDNQIAERTLMRMRASKVLGAGAVVFGGLLLSTAAASPTWAMTPSQQNGQYSQYDMGDIEYFNMMEFEENLTLSVEQPTPENYIVKLVCPTRESQNFPPPTLDISLTTADGQQTTDCANPVPLSISRQAAECTPTGICDLLFKASNGITGLTYSTTMTDLQLSRVQDLIPQLNPATLPQNAHGETLPPNEAYSNGSAKLQLCESTQQCAGNGSPNAGYSYNTQVYFQTLLRDKIPN